MSEAHECIESLDDFLAFVDTLELSDAESVSSSSDSGSTEMSPTRKPLNGKKRRRNRANLSSSTRLQQSKKAETLFLRRRVFELEGQLTQLKITKCGMCALLRRRESSNTTNKPKSKWVEAAETEYHARLESEKINRTLKTLVAKQMGKSMSLQATMLKQIASNEKVLVEVLTLLPASPKRDDM